MISIPSNPLSAGARTVVRRLTEKGFTALWAGGCVRDLLMGRAPKDFDIATSAVPDQVERLFPGAVTVGKSYGLTLCAERTALGTAIAAGYRRFTAVAIASSGQTAPMPCGACLQALAEFCRPDFVIVTAAAQNTKAMAIYPLKDLLPRAFRLG